MWNKLFISNVTSGLPYMWSSTIQWSTINNNNHWIYLSLKMLLGSVCMCSSLNLSEELSQSLVIPVYKGWTVPDKLLPYLRNIFPQSSNSRLAGHMTYWCVGILLHCWFNLWHPERTTDTKDTRVCTSSHVESGR